MMGQLVDKMTEPLQNCTVANILGVQRKRKRSVESDDADSESKGDEVNFPKKKRLLTTTQYIYQALFRDEKSSDVSVMALGHVWHLHKVYLCQSPYFHSMFNGSWKECSEDFVHIKILDELITFESLDAVFGSLYSDEIEIKPKAVISLLATATLFHLESIIEKCAETMIENIDCENVVQYYEASCQYGCLNVKRAAFDWLEKNLLCVFMKHHKLLKFLSIELMTKLISSPDLYVLQTEFSLYTMLRTWIFLCFNPDYIFGTPTTTQQTGSSTANWKDSQENGQNSNSNELREFVSTEAITEFLNAREDKRPFLLTPQGLPFVKPFQALRTQYLTNHQMDLKIILNDNILPKEWVHSHVLSHWNSILKVDHLPEEGPQNLDPEEFFQNCMRCGRILFEPGYQKWRWTGFNFGLDLIIISDGRLLTIRRHHRNEHERLLSLQLKRQFMIRTCITAVNKCRQPLYTQKSEIMSLSLEKNEEVTLMVLDSNLKHPLLISVNLLVVPPVNQNFKSELLSSEEKCTVPISEIGANCERTTKSSPTNDSQNDSAVCVDSPSVSVLNLAVRGGVDADGDDEAGSSTVSSGRSGSSTGRSCFPRRAVTHRSSSASSTESNASSTSSMVFL